MTIIQNHPTSSLAQGLTAYQNRFYKEASEDQTVGGLLKYHVVGTLLTGSITLILHAEAVRRAVIICFLSIVKTFTQSNEELLATQQKEWTFAYSQSLRSFCALFNRKMLISSDELSQTSQSQEPKLAEPVEVRLDIPAPAANIEQVVVEQIAQRQLLPEPAQEQAPLGAAPAHVEALPHDEEDGVLVEEEAGHDDDLVHVVAEPAQDNQPLAAAAPDADEDDLIFVGAELPAAELPVPPAAAAAPAAEPAVILAAALPVADHDLNDQEFEIVNVDLGLVAPQGAAAPAAIALAPAPAAPAPAAIALAPAAAPAAIAPAPAAAAAIVLPEVVDFVADEALQPGMLTVDEEIRLKHEMESSEIRKRTFQQQMQIVPLRDVAASLRAEIIDATAQVASADRQIAYVRAPQDVQDPKWKFSNGFVGRHQVGLCHFAKGQHILGAQHLASLLTLRVKGQELQAPIFGLFDPQVGSRASQYLVKTLPGVLTTELNHFNRDELTPDGIWNALTQTFLKLNSDFIKTNRAVKVNPRFSEVIADHGSSAAVVLMLGGYLWVTHLGNTRVAIDNGGEPIQMTTDPDPRNPKYEQLVRSLGGEVDEYGLVNGKLNMATGFGRYDLRGAISSKPFITQFPMARIKEESHLIIGTVWVAQSTSTARQTRWLHDDRNVDAKNLAHNVVHSVHKVNQTHRSPTVQDRALSTMVLKINAIDEWEEV